MLVIKEWPAQTPLSEIKFDSVSLWLRVYGLPICYFSDDNAKRIGQRARKVINVMVPRPRSSLWGRSLRIQVEVSLLKPIIAGFFLKNEWGTPQWIQLKYEQVCNFCYHCGMLDHEKKDCISLTLAMISDASGRKVQLYRPWVSAGSSIISCFATNLVRDDPSLGNVARTRQPRKPEIELPPEEPKRIPRLEYHPLTVNVEARHVEAGDWSGSATNQHYEEVSDMQRALTSLANPETELLVKHADHVTTKALITSSAEAQRAMEQERKKQRGGNVFILHTTVAELNSQLEFLLHPNLRDQFQPHTSYTHTSSWVM
ncbi:Zinc knuckle CX2CX4HX4C [Trema orientale]|uniref:Zinc knuckle CX2CX4HX4C n=1 Tax=Trema orientale TaxID=63057 RepID=A0A2P5EZU6_TREOI|nr:Zinc knuckle CX2CX4HX4C [Trema orientale]